MSRTHFPHRNRLRTDKLSGILSSHVDLKQPIHLDDVVAIGWPVSGVKPSRPKLVLLDRTDANNVQRDSIDTMESHRAVTLTGCRFESMYYSFGSSYLGWCTIRSRACGIDGFVHPIYPSSPTCKTTNNQPNEYPWYMSYILYPP